MTTCKCGATALGEIKVDNILPGVSRAALPPKEDSNWTSRNVSSLDVKVFVNHIQSVHLLAFVLVKTRFGCQR